MHIIAHRGWSGKAPENTIAAFQKALDDPRVQGIELDVNMTKDGVPIVIHDPLLDRTTDRTGPVYAHTWAELRDADAGSWFAPSFAGERIPRLEDVLALCKGRLPLYIELKQFSGLYKGLEERVASLLREADMLEEASVISFDHRSLQRLKEGEPRAQTRLVVEGCLLDFAGAAQAIGASGVHMNYRYFSAPLATELRAAGLHAVVWTVDRREDAERLFRIDPDVAFTSNHPDRLQAQSE